MSLAMISAIKLLADKNIEDTVKALSVKFNFEFSDAMAFVMNEMPVEEPVKKTKKVKKADDKPKRATTGYLTYSKELREQVKADLTAKLEGDDKLKPQAIVKELGARWKDLSEDDQKEWNAKAKAASSSSDEE